MIKGMQIADKENAVIPANWSQNSPIINKSPQTFEELENRQNEIVKEKNGMNWYLSFKLPENSFVNDKNT